MNRNSHHLPSSRGRWWWLPNLALGLASLLLLASLAGNALRAVWRGAYPPPGQMVDVGGYRLHLHCMGQGEPTVIFEAAVTSPSLTWGLIQPEVAKTTRACVYDRAGLGWSDPSPRPRSVGNMAEELHLLLQAAGIPGPYVLVGYSSGGWQARYYAHAYQGDLAGMVMVDSAHEDQLQRLGAEGSPALEKVLPLIPALVKSGLPALAAPLLPVPGKNALDQNSVRAYQGLLVTEDRFSETLAAEMAEVWDNMARVRAAQIRSFGDVPIIVLAHSGLAVIPGVNLSPEANQIWLELQAELADLSSNGKLVITEESGHDIHLEQPDLVIGAILDVVQQARLIRANK
jgi:pimeloyl-ACP methyl ester carboxylesterase